MTSMRLSALPFLIIPPLACFARLSVTWMPPVSRLIGEGGREVGFEVVAMNGLETSPVAVPDGFGNRLFVGELYATKFKPVAREGVSGVLVSDRDRNRVGVLGLLAGIPVEEE
jgi:hypothetical protein